MLKYLIASFPILLAVLISDADEIHPYLLQEWELVKNEDEQLSPQKIGRRIIERAKTDDGLQRNIKDILRNNRFHDEALRAYLFVYYIEQEWPMEREIYSKILATGADPLRKAVIYNVIIKRLTPSYQEKLKALSADADDAKVKQLAKLALEEFPKKEYLLKFLSEYSQEKDLKVKNQLCITVADKIQQDKILQDVIRSIFFTLKDDPRKQQIVRAIFPYILNNKELPLELFLEGMLEKGTPEDIRQLARNYISEHQSEKDGAR